MRHVNNVTFVSPGFARYTAGVRFAFGGDAAAAAAASADGSPPPPPASGDADLRGRFGDPGDRCLPGTAAATAAAAAGSRTRG